MTRVLHLHSGNMYGGVETLLVTLAREREVCPGLEPEFALCAEGRLSQELEEADVPVHQLGQVRLRQPLGVVRARRALDRLMRRSRLDVVIAHSPWAQALFGGTIRASGVRQGLWIHDAMEGRHWLERLAARSVPDFAVCNSRFTRGRLSRLYADDLPAGVVYCAVAPPRGDGGEAERSRVREDLGVEEDQVVVVQVGRMEPYKGHGLHLDALARLRDLPGWVCWQVGGGQRPYEVDYLEALKRQAASLGIADRVRFLGQRTDVARLLAAADVYCQPNIRPEAFGISFIEALDAGLPVVTTGIGGALEIVDGRCGIITPPGDPAALAEAIERLVRDSALRRRLGAAGPARARHLTDPAMQLGRLQELITRVESAAT